MKKSMIFILAAVLILVGLILQFTVGNMFSAGDFSMNYFAAGDYACGVFASGTFAIGIFSAGIFSCGIFSLGIFNIAVYATGFFAWAYKKRRMKLDENK
jgi:hypothetical protein